MLRNLHVEFIMNQMYHMVPSKLDYAQLYIYLGALLGSKHLASEFIKSFRQQQLRSYILPIYHKIITAIFTPSHHVS